MLRIVLAGCLLLAGCGGEETSPVHVHFDRAGKIWIEKPPDDWEYAFGGISFEIKEKNGRWQATLNSRFRKVTPAAVTGAATWIGMAVGRARAGQGLRGDMRLNMDLQSQQGTLDLTDFREGAYRNLRYDIRWQEGRFVRTDGEQGTIDGHFRGDQGQYVTGTVHLPDAAIAWAGDNR